MKTLKIMAALAIMLLSVSVMAQLNGPFGFECNMPSNPPNPVDNLVGGLYKPESIDIYTNDPNAVFPVLIVYVQYPNDPGADVSWWPVSNNQPPTFLGDVIAEEKTSNTGANWWDAYNSKRLSDFWMEASRGELHLVGQEVHIVLSKEYGNYSSVGEIFEEIFTALESEIGQDWPFFDKWSKVNGTFVYGNGDGWVDMIYLVARSNPTGAFTSNGVMNGCSHTIGYHTVYTNGSQSIKIKPGFNEEGAGFQICGTQPLNAEYLVSFSGHEHGHYLFGNGNYFEYHQQYSKVNNYHGFEEYLSPYELLRLGYHTPQVADFSDVTMPIGDFASFTTNSGSEIIKVPIGSSSRNEFFLIANRQNVSAYDHLMWGDTAHDDCYRTLSSAAQDYDKGIYIYHAYPGQIGSGYPWGIRIDIECADGLWDWVQSGTQTPDWNNSQYIPYYKRNTPEYSSNDNGGTFNSTQSLSNHDGLSIGYEGQAVWFGTGKRHTSLHQDGIDRTFTNLEEVWTSREWKGDRWDAWRVGYNEVFSPYSSPSTVDWDNNSTGIFIYLNSMNGNTANMEIYKVGEGGWDESEILQATPPSRPILYRPVEMANCNGTNGNPRIIWDNSLEPDMVRTSGARTFKRYKIYRASSNLTELPLTYYYLATYDDYTPNDTANFIDNDSYNGVLLPCADEGGGNQYWRYKISAVDVYEDESVKSDFVSTRGTWASAPDNMGIENEMPKVFSLNQNYPNPFNPTTDIKFELPKDNFVTVKVYNAIGEEVAVLINNEWKTTGRYSVKFDGSNLASGIYFYSIHAGNFTDTKKMVLIK